MSEGKEASKGKRTDEETRCRQRERDRKGCSENERERRERVGVEGALPVGSVEKGDRGGYGMVVVVMVVVVVVTVEVVWVNGGTGSVEGREG